MKIDLKGCTRIVFIFKYIVIKIPNFQYEHSHFLIGCTSNWEERKYYKSHINIIYENNLAHFVAPSLWCSWFGLIQIQAKCEPLLRDLTEEECEFFQSLCKGDNKKENFGWYKGKLVCVDYG